MASSATARKTCARFMRPKTIRSRVDRVPLVTTHRPHSDLVHPRTGPSSVSEIGCVKRRQRQKSAKVSLLAPECLQLACQLPLADLPRVWRTRYGSAGLERPADCRGFVIRTKVAGFRNSIGGRLPKQLIRQTTACVRGVSDRSGESSGVGFAIEEVEILLAHKEVGRMFPGIRLAEPGRSASRWNCRLQQKPVHRSKIHSDTDQETRQFSGTSIAAGSVRRAAASSMA